MFKVHKRPQIWYSSNRNYHFLIWYILLVFKNYHWQPWTTLSQTLLPKRCTRWKHSYLGHNTESNCWLYAGDLSMINTIINMRRFFFCIGIWWMLKCNVNISKMNIQNMEYVLGATGSAYFEMIMTDWFEAHHSDRYWYTYTYSTIHGRNTKQITTQYRAWCLNLILSAYVYWCVIMTVLLIKCTFWDQECYQESMTKFRWSPNKQIKLFVG